MLEKNEQEVEISKENPGRFIPVPTPTFLTVKQYAERYPYPSESSLRWHLFHSSTNGLESAVIRIGKRIVLDLDALNAWIRSHKKEIQP